MLKRVVVVATLAVSGCTVPAGDPPASGPVGPSVPAVEIDTCNAAQMASFIGRPATSLETKLLLQPVRIIRPGDSVTEDFLPARLNIHLDSNNIIRKLTCG